MLTLTREYAIDSKTSSANSEGVFEPFHVDAVPWKEFARCGDLSGFWPRSSQAHRGKLPQVSDYGVLGGRLNSDKAFKRLQELGADQFAHVNGSLALHLRGTEALLKRWGSRKALCLGGLYHAVYGTDGIRGSLVGVNMREAIAQVIGIEAESLAYRYGACAREAFHPRIGTPDQLRFVDRFTYSEYAITESQLRDFCELTLANELELALSSEAFRTGYRAELADFFEHMRGLISEAGFEAYRRTLCESLRGATRHRIKPARGGLL